MTPQAIAECALAALRSSHRDASWLASEMLDVARKEVFDHQRFRAAMELAAKTAGLRDALAERIALLEPQVAATVADQKRDGGLYAHAH